MTWVAPVGRGRAVAAQWVWGPTVADAAERRRDGVRHGLRCAPGGQFDLAHQAYIPDESDVFDVDEAIFVVLVLLVPPAFTVLVFAAAVSSPRSCAAARLRRRSTSGVLWPRRPGALVFVARRQPPAPSGYAKVGAAFAGAARTSSSTARHGSILAIRSASWRDTLLRGSTTSPRHRRRYRLRRSRRPAACLSAGLPAAGRASHPRAALPRARGTSRPEATGSGSAACSGQRSTSTAPWASTRPGRGMDLRRIPAALTRGHAHGRAPGPTAAGRAMRMADRTLWLGSGPEPVSRSTSRPALLEALASVGAIALANADLYEEVRRQKESSPSSPAASAKGCAPSAQVWRITFMNPAGARMLGWEGLETDDDRPVVPPGRRRTFLRDLALRALVLAAQRHQRRHPFRATDGRTSCHHDGLARRGRRRSRRGR